MIAQSGPEQIERFQYADMGSGRDSESDSDALPVVMDDVLVLRWKSGGPEQSLIYDDKSGVDSGADTESHSDESVDAVAEEAVREQHFQQLLKTESSKAEEQGYSRGMEDGLRAGREESNRELTAERERLVAQGASLLESFSKGREQYLHDLEQRAAELALAIAARILRREAQADPLLLTGAVRVALGQLAASTAVRLRVPVEDESMWQETMALMPGLTLRPEVVGDAEMGLGECRIETELGSADLGLWSQLKAIEKGFFIRGEVADVH